MSELSEYIKHARHFDGLGMGDQELERRAKALEAERDRYREALERAAVILRHDMYEQRAVNALVEIEEALDDD